MSERRRIRGTGQPRDGTELVYERYKDALRRGHVAALRGEVDDAVRAYDEAASIAPHRPMARASAGAALARAGRAVEALVHFDAAVQLVPRDETTRSGRAQARAALGRRHDAADDLDVVAELREADGRLSEALDSAGRALELAEARHRRATVRRLVAALEGSELDEPLRTALAGAMRVLETRIGDGPVDGTVDGRAAGEPEGQERAQAPQGGQAAAPDGRVVTAPDPAILAAAADAALDAGDGAAARVKLLELAAVHRADGRLDAALDACYLALGLAPDDMDLHVAFLGIYEARGWTALATEKRGLLARLADLDGDREGAARIAPSPSGPG